jgi:SanA protein
MPDEAVAPAPRKRWGARSLLVAAIAGAVFVVSANLYLIAAARAATVSSGELAPVRPYAIVLGNRVYPSGAPSPELAERLGTGLALYQAGRAGKIVVSGGVKGSYNEPAAMAAWLEARGVPRADVIQDGGGHRTAATMADAVALGIRSAHVVSQGYHLPRALFLARKAGIDATGVPAVAWREGLLDSTRVFFRETLARAEAVVEVALRGVR